MIDDEKKFELVGVPIVNHRTPPITGVRVPVLLQGEMLMEVTDPDAADGPRTRVQVVFVSDLGMFACDDHGARREVDPKTLTMLPAPKPFVPMWPRFEFASTGLMRVAVEAAREDEKRRIREAQFVALGGNPDGSVSPPCTPVAPATMIRWKASLAVDAAMSRYRETMDRAASEDMAKRPVLFPDARRGCRHLKPECSRCYLDRCFPARATRRQLFHSGLATLLLAGTIALVAVGLALAAKFGAQ